MGLQADQGDNDRVHWGQTRNQDRKIIGWVLAPNLRWRAAVARCKTPSPALCRYHFRSIGKQFRFTSNEGGYFSDDVLNTKYRLICIRRTGPRREVGRGQEQWGRRQGRMVRLRWEDQWDGTRAALFRTNSFTPFCLHDSRKKHGNRQYFPSVRYKDVGFNPIARII